MLRKKSHRNNKQLYYSLNFLKLLIPNFFYRNRLKETLNEINKYDVDYIKMRVNYYNKIDRDINLPDNVPDGQLYKQAGNSVTVELITQLAKLIKKTIQ